jgi:hypothetical protein
MTHVMCYMAALLAVAGMAFADTVTELSGRQWSGTIVSTNDSTVVIRLDDGLELSIPRARVRTTEYNAEQPRSGPTTSPPATSVPIYDQSGRVELSVWGTAYGLYNGALAAVLLDGNEDAVILAMLAGAATGFYVPWTWSRTHNVSEARATLMNFGGTWGMWQGFGWPLALVDDDEYEKGIIVSAMVGGAVGLLSAGHLTADTDISRGDAELVRTFPIWSSIYVSWLMNLVGVNNERVMLSSILAAGDVGILLGASVARRVEYTRGDVRLMNLGGLLGALVGGSVVVLTDISNEKAIFSTIMIGSTAGIGVAWRLLTPVSSTAEALPSIELAPTLVRSPEDYLRSLPAMGMRIRF